MNEFATDFYQNMLTLVIVITSCILLFIFSSRQKKDFKIIISLFFWHSIFSIYYFTYTLTNQADARKYYRISLNDDLIVSPGTKFIYYLTSLPTKYLDASYLNVTLLYNLLGSFGLVFLYLSFKFFLKNLPWYWIFILFIPSMSFWSAGLGKDAISFFAICLFLYGITVSNRAALLIPVSFFIMFMVRPHIAAIMIVSYVIYFIIKAKVHIIFKVFTLPIISLGVFLSVSFVQQYIGLEEASLSSVSGYIDDRQGSNLGGGSSLDIASMSYPMQMFTYIFRPLPFEASSAVTMITSIENTFLLFLILYILFKSKFNLRPFVQGKNLWLFTYVFLTCSILAMTTANLGIATRQKWMFMPVLLYLLIYSFHNYKLNKSRIYQ